MGKGTSITCAARNKITIAVRKKTAADKRQTKMVVGKKTFVRFSRRTKFRLTQTTVFARKIMPNIPIHCSGTRFTLIILAKIDSSGQFRVNGVLM